jgi:methionyl aminopeptidase
VQSINLKGVFILEEEEVRKYIKAGEIAKRVRDKAEKIVKPGVRLLDIASELEKEILEQGAQPAFPVNIGVNEVAAHYTPTPGDPSVIPEGSVVKVDLGVHVDGYIADTATTISLNPALEGLVEAARRALEEVVEVFKPGIRAREIGRVVERVIKSSGFKPITNLTGHSIDRFMIHSGRSIPNYDDITAIWRIKQGVYAVEPFATDGTGLVREGDHVTIYALRPLGRAKLSSVEEEFYNLVYSERRTLPFALRWYQGVRGDVTSVLDDLGRRGVLVKYPVLIERSGRPVAQFEHTFLVLDREVVVTTI